MHEQNNHKSADKKITFLPTDSTEIDFIFKKCDAPRLSLVYWRSVPEFFDEIVRVSKTDATIDNGLVFKIMLEIYREKENDMDTGFPVDFNFRLARKSLNRLSQILFGDNAAWKTK